MDQQVQEVMQPQMEPEQEVNYDDGGAVPDTGYEGGGSGLISCQVCTYDNDPSLSKCEICENPLPHM